MPVEFQPAFFYCFYHPSGLEFHFIEILFRITSSHLRLRSPKLKETIRNLFFYLRPMRIGFDAKRIFQNATGLGNYSRTVVKNLTECYPDNQYFLFTPTSRHRHPFEAIQNTHLVVGKGSVWRSFGIRKDIARNQIDVYHGLSNELPFSINKIDIKTVVTIHDLIFEHFPHHYPGVDRKVYDVKSKFAVNNADVIIAASESTRLDIIKFYEADEKKIKVIYQNCDDIFYSTHNYQLNYNLPSEYILYVGSITERKNILAICKAYSLLDKHKRVPCVLVGNGGTYSTQVKEFLAENHLENYFIFLENVPTEHLPQLYKNALCFIYPSLYEGFGIPVLEAMVSGCPVITSMRSSLPEVGGTAAWYIDPEAPADIADKLMAVISSSDVRREMINSGSEQIKKFEKKKIAKEMMDAYSGI